MKHPDHQKDNISTSHQPASHQTLPTDTTNSSNNNNNNKSTGDSQGLYPQFQEENGTSFTHKLVVDVWFQILEVCG